MNIHSIVPGAGAILFGLLLTLIAYGIICKSFTNKEFSNWLNNRKRFYQVLGPTLILIGIIILLFN